MQGPTAQLVALCCHFNGRVRGLTSEPFFPTNSTCQFCEYIQFGDVHTDAAGSRSWTLTAPTPEDWLDREATPDRSAHLLYATVNHPFISDRMSAGFVGGGGQWRLAIADHGKMDEWEAGWHVGNRQAADRRIWQVRYGRISENVDQSLPNLPTLEILRPKLSQALSDILTFAEQHNIDGFAACFGKAIEVLSSDDPMKSIYHTDLSPPGLLSLAASQLLAASEAAWVFGGMGSWNDMTFEGAEQVRYDTLSEALFALLNACICASANSGALA